jgi:hypothetical protein
MQQLAGKMRIELIYVIHSAIRSVINTDMDRTLDKPAQDEQTDYGLEVLCASWNPLASALAEPVQACRELVDELATADAEDFLASFYRSQQG